MHKKSILITGSAGFFGSILKKRLLLNGHTCVGIDLHPDYHTHSNFIPVQGDIRNLSTVKTLFETYAFDVVFHCAAILAHERPSKKFLWESNVDGTKHIVENCIEYQVPKIIFISSNCLWGHNINRAITEKDIPSPIEIYGKSKLAAEQLLLHHKQDLDVVIIRCPTIIDEGRLGLLAILFEFIYEGRTIWTVGSGNNRYQFVYAPDLADACIKAINYNSSNIFNVGSDNVETLRNIYLKVKEYANTSSKVKQLPKTPTLFAMKLAYLLRLSPLGPYQYKMIAEDFQFDTSKTKKHLDWKPTLNNSKMLTTAYDYYQKNRQEIIQRTNASSHKTPAKMGIIKILKWLS